MTTVRPTWWQRLDRTGLPLLLARLALAAVLLIYGAVKIEDPVKFLKLMHQYRVVPDSAYAAMNTMAVVLPWIEVTCGTALLLGVAVRAAGVVAALLLAGFTPLILLRGLELYHGGAASSFCGVNFDCGCGAGNVYVCNKLAENVGLFLLALIPIFSRSRRLCLGALWDRARRAAPPRTT